MTVLNNGKYYPKIMKYTDRITGFFNYKNL